MVPVEWPIDAPASDGGYARARLAPRDRLPCVRADLFLDPRARLSEQERSLLTALMADLVSSVSDEFLVALGEPSPANDEDESLLDRLWRTGLLDIPDLIRLLLRRADEERLAAAIHDVSGSSRARFAQSLVGDEDADISAAAMALILARGRRRDRFDAPRIAFDDLSAEAAVALVNAVAAGLRDRVADRLGVGQADERLTAAAHALLAGHDEGKRLEARIFDLVHALDRAGRLDDRCISLALHEGQVAFVVEALARRSGIPFDSAWDRFAGGKGELALLLRLARSSRELAGEILSQASDLVGSDAEFEIAAFDTMAGEEVERARDWLRFDPNYRRAIEALGNGNRAL